MKTLQAGAVSLAFFIATFGGTGASAQPAQTAPAPTQAQPVPAQPDMKASAAPAASDAPAAYDPLEGMNRFFFRMNQKLERNAGVPAGNAYRENVPQGVRGGLRNLMDNLGGPVTVANSLLQFKFKSAATAAGRFLVNTTAGVAGIFDIATDWGMPGRNRDFGETMGNYGVPPGPYLVLPFRGSTDVRDFAGSYVDGYASPLRYVQYEGNNYVGLVKGALGSAENRATNNAALAEIERNSVDYYAAMRTRFLLRRQKQIEDRPEPVMTAALPAEIAVTPLED